MLQTRRFKIFVWFMATFFFFLASGVIISILKPGPSEAEVMKFMAGTMTAMESSIMGVMMNIDHDGLLKSIIVLSTAMMMPIIIMSIIIGAIIRVAAGGKKNV